MMNDCEAKRGKQKTKKEMKEKKEKKREGARVMTFQSEEKEIVRNKERETNKAHSRIDRQQGKQCMLMR